MSTSPSFTGQSYDTYRSIEGKLAATPVTVPSLGPHDVLIQITHTGVCYTDLEVFRSGGPVALGHEGVGKVVAIGSAVTALKIGDRAGGGFHRDGCGVCKYCLTGHDIYCDKRVIMGEGDYDNGTFGKFYVGKETYVHKIPDGIPSAEAGPLQCAGATVYSALVNNVKANQRVGIMGIGGLGHLGIQFASKLGADVVVFSTTADKEAEAKGFGANEFVLNSELDKLSAPVDVLILTANKYPDWDKLLVKTVLARQGTIIPLTAPVAPLNVPAWPFFFDGYKLVSSLVASRQQHDDMLNFVARNGIKPKVEVYPHKGVESVDQSFERLQKGPRYRVVLAYE